MTTGISSWRIADTPIAVIDFETTGLTPGYDRVVEVAVVRIEPGQAPRLAFDSLIHPARPMAATEIHGIQESDVMKAPRFHEIAGEFLTAAQGCVIAIYNVYFDLPFLNFELSNAGVTHEPPHFCLMSLRTMLGHGSRCKLEEACQSLGVDYPNSHVASSDALAAAQLYCHYRNDLRAQDISTFADLTKRKTYKFNNSFTRLPFSSSLSPALREGPSYSLSPALRGEGRGEGSSLEPRRFDRLFSRAGRAAEADPERRAVAAYWDALTTALADLEISDEEITALTTVRQRSNLKEEQIRSMHAKAFASIIVQFTRDQLIDDRESARLKRLYGCLAKLGWAPGQ
jgi:DNA polymerase III subunit epsilon